MPTWLGLFVGGIVVLGSSVGILMTGRFAPVALGGQIIGGWLLLVAAITLGVELGTRRPDSRMGDEDVR